MRKQSLALPLFLLSVFFVVLAWSAIRPKEYFTWFLEVVPALAGLVVLIATYKRFPLTALTYALILLHSIILMVGGHYTYAEVPFGDWAREAFGMERNNYDKLGHFAQGFVPAMITREILLRRRVVANTGWRNFFIVCVCMSVSVVYEFVEWLAAAVSGTAAEAFLGSQGYEWDTQSDMLYATAGAISALVILSRCHDRQLARFIVN
jgi:putative membrane protein